MTSLATKLTLIAGRTVLTELAGLRLLTDPTFDPPGRYPNGPVTLEKTQRPALDVAALGAIDAVLLSHDSTRTTWTMPAERCCGTCRWS